MDVLERSRNIQRDDQRMACVASHAILDGLPQALSHDHFIPGSAGPRLVRQNRTVLMTSRYSTLRSPLAQIQLDRAPVCCRRTGPDP
jgi:hypothetical protein